MSAECQKDSCAAILQIIYTASYLRQLKNNRITKGFDRLAPIYTGLSRIVFGKALENAQKYFLSSVHADDHVLILGGGSGEILKSLLNQQPHVAVDYIDISAKMIQLARRQTKSPSNVNFIIGTEQNIPGRTYTVVVTNFYLDLFSDNTLPHVIQKIKRHLTPGAQWLATDFVSNKGWHKILLWIMYRFFRSAAGIEACSLPYWEKFVEQAGLKESDSRVFYKGFIKAVWYTKA